MQPTSQLITKFFKRECTPHEAELVHRYLANNPEAMDQYLGEGEWQELTHFKSPEAGRSAQILKNILSHVEPEPEARVFRLNLRVLSRIAACLCVFATYLLWLHVNPAPVLKNAPVLAAQKPLIWKTTANRSNTVLNITLDDGSRVALHPKSSVQYTQPFKRARRNIHLKGEAKFYVAKDKKRPFTVYAGPLATTALGTVFNITAWPGGSRTKVRLLSGKVKVVQHQHVNPDAQAVYLLPGKELVFNNKKQSLLVSAFNNEPAKPLITVQPGTTIVKGDSLNFTNQQLPLVINKLQETYHVRIQPGINLKKYYFTGDFNSRTQPITQVLNTITTLNKLNYNIQTDSTFIITKK
ncbi:FecR family protein [Mucilaginibacter terrae]|uniref:Transmembrane sensor n=1 Tax=Mucilaginibacter terrae TaxID=1955052 RepID=A0ABU3GUY4_9SPHI|nr:FecR family protein [Mucilaginibacter terrae]MDT3403583.1 transmembrane sensor [Mucilaginibacter terrae]